MGDVMVFLSENLGILLSFVSGGGLFALFSLPSSKKKAEAEALTAMQAMYSQAMTDANKQLGLMREEYNERFGSLKKEFDKLKDEFEALKAYKCTVMDCKMRKR